MFKKNIKLLAITLPVLLVSLGACSDGFLGGLKCVQYSKVVSIDAIIYRGGYVTLENGDSVKVGQQHNAITIGYNWCTRYDYQ